MSRTGRVLATVAAITLAMLGMSSATAQEEPDRVLYRVIGTEDVESPIASSGVDVLGVREGVLEVVASPEQASSLRARGFTLEPTGDLDAMLAKRGGRSVDATDFPAGDEGYHTYDEMVAEVRTATTDHGAIAASSSVGTSHEGRDIPLVKISDNVTSDDPEPEVLFTCNMHAREHLTLEMCLHIVNRFTDGYGTDEKITRFVDTREIWVIPSLNPDGAEFDISGGQYQGWRKNRQPNADGTIGTDLNRNFAYKWACCGGASDDPSAQTYRGPSAVSSPEVKAIQDWVNSRVVGGVQQLRAHIDFHTFSELVLWPFGYTLDQVTEGMTQDEYTRIQALGTKLATANGYTPGQASTLYITDGDINDWMWGTHKVLSYCFEMYPKSGSTEGFYPPDEVISRETSRNDSAIDILLTNAA